MPIGKKVGSMKNLKTSLKRGSMGPIRYIPKNGELTVRFLEEPEEWVNYWEHFDPTLRKSYPCVDNDCPGCAEELRRTSRYLANAVDLKDDKVIALQMPKDLTNQLVRRYERYDTIMDRDYTLVRAGEGLDTSYDSEAEPPFERKLTKYDKLDLQDVLDQVYKSVHDPDDDDEDDEPKSKKKSGAASGAGKKRRSSAAERLAKSRDDEEDDDDEDDDDEDVEAPKKSTAKKSTAAKKRFVPPPRDEEDEDEDEDEDEEDEEDEDEDQDEDWYDEDDLTEMSVGQLRVIAKELDVDAKGLKKAELVEAILDAQEA